MEQFDEEFTEILSLVTQLKEGTIPAGQFMKLEKMLSDNPAARQYYDQIIELYTDMEWLFKNHQK